MNSGGGMAPSSGAASAPALKARDAVADGIHDGLEVDLDLAIRDGIGQAGFDLELARGAHMDAAVKGHDLCAAVALGFVHGRFGLAQQPFGVQCAQRRRAHAEGRGDGNALAIDDEGLAEQGFAACAQMLKCRLTAKMRDYDEGVAAKAHQGLALRAPVPQPLGHGGHDGVAEGMAIGVVDELEAVQSQHHQRHMLLVAGGIAVALQQQRGSPWRLGSPVRSSCVA